MEEHMKPILNSIAAGSLLAALAIAQPAPRYTVTDLGAVGGAPGQPYFIKNNGLVSGAAATPGGAMHPVLWYQGLKIDIGTPGLAGLNSAAYGVNELGQTVGTAQTSVPNSEDFCGFSALGLPTSNTACLPFLWQFGAMTKLPTLGGANGVANSINNRGVVAGYAETTAKDPNPACPVSQFAPVVWENGAIHQLQTHPGDPDGVAAMINDKGQVVGASGTCQAFDPNNGYLVLKHALLWENGAVTDLGNLGGTGGPAGNHACAINNRGQVVGHAVLADDITFHAFLWTRASGMRDLGTLPGDFASISLGINDGGEMVGLSLDAKFNPRAVLWEKGQMAWENSQITDLNTLIPANSGLYLLTAVSINSSGQITGLAVTSGGVLHGFLATPQ
jgi:probable HAF family extracellular repeat protein